MLAWNAVARSTGRIDSSTRHGRKLSSKTEARSEVTTPALSRDGVKLPEMVRTPSGETPSEPSGETLDEAPDDRAPCVSVCAPDPDAGRTNRTERIVPAGPNLRSHSVARRSRSVNGIAAYVPGVFLKNRRISMRASDFSARSAGAPAAGRETEGSAFDAAARAVADPASRAEESSAAGIHRRERASQRTRDRTDDNTETSRGQVRIVVSLSGRALVCTRIWERERKSTMKIR